MHARGEGVKKSTILAYTFFLLSGFFSCPRSSVLFYCCFAWISFVCLNIKSNQTPMCYLILTPIIFLSMAQQTILFGNVLPKQNCIYNIFSFKIGKDTYKKEINIKTSVSVFKMLQNLIIYLHAGHLKMVDVHFLRVVGGSGKVCFLHNLENGWQLWMTPYIQSMLNLPRFISFLLYKSLPQPSK